MSDRGLTNTYEQSRRRFLDSARAAGATIESYPHPVAGNGRGARSPSMSRRSGTAEAPAVLLVVSGTHGVEGFTGSALQHHWLDGLGPGDIPDGLRVVLLHAFNPYGFAWVRRVNEDNVDLNRNFVDWSQPPPAERGLRRAGAPARTGLVGRRHPTVDHAADPRLRRGGRLRTAAGGRQRRAVHASDRGLLRRHRPGVVASLARGPHRRPRGPSDAAVHRRPAHRSRPVGSWRVDLPRGPRRPWLPARYGVVG